MTVRLRISRSFAVVGLVCCVVLGVATAPAQVSAAPAPAEAARANAVAAPGGAAAAPARAVVWGKLTAAEGGKVYDLSGAEVTIGTDAACQVQLADKTVAPRHAKLTYAEGVIEVHDLGARGGTLVAGTAVKMGKPFRLLQPVELTFAAATVQFAFGERPSMLAPTQKPAASGKARANKAAPVKAKGK